MRSAFLLMNKKNIQTKYVTVFRVLNLSILFYIIILFQSSKDNIMDIEEDIRNVSCFILVPDRREKIDRWSSNCESINILVHGYFKYRGFPHWNSGWKLLFYSINMCRRKRTYDDRFHDCLKRLHSMENCMEKNNGWIFFFNLKIGFVFFRLNILSCDNVYMTFYITF